MNIDDVLSGRAGSQGIRWLLLSTTAKKALADQLRALLPDGAAVRECRLREVRFKPGRKITAYYDVSASPVDSEGQQVRPVAVTWEQNAHAPRHEETAALARMQAEAVRRGVAAPFERLLGHSCDWKMRICVSPLDARFTQLARVSDPRHIRNLLTRTGIAASPSRRSGEYTVTPLKYRPGKTHILRYDPLDPGGDSVFAKLYIIEGQERAFRREDPARCFRVARNAADWLEERGDCGRALRPLAYFAEDAVVVYPQAAGTPLSDYARRRVDEVAPWFERAGAVLRNLHEMPVELLGPLGPPHDFAAEIRLIAKKSEHILALVPEVASAIEALLNSARELAERLPQEPPTFTHGDLKSEHIWVAPGRLTLMDFDTSHLADPALDLGCFLADWQFWNVTCHAGLEKMQESFLAGYSPGVPKERLMRARLYEAIELVKCAVRRVQLFEHDWAHRTAALVERAQAVLDHLQFTFGIARYGCAATTGEERRELP